MGKPIDSETWRRAGQGALLGGVSSGVLKIAQGQNPFAITGSGGYFEKLARRPLYVVGGKFLEESFKKLFKMGLGSLLWPSPAYAPTGGFYTGGGGGDGGSAGGPPSDGK